jgi:16S rRNA C967 or C1407 C5-methylase (RsmB/RsmF family)
MGDIKHIFFFSELHLRQHCTIYWTKLTKKFTIIARLNDKYAELRPAGFKLHAFKIWTKNLDWFVELIKAIFSVERTEILLIFIVREHIKNKRTTSLSKKLDTVNEKFTQKNPVLYVKHVECELVCQRISNRDFNMWLW